MINHKYEYHTIRDIPVMIHTHTEEEVSDGTEVILPSNSRLKISLDYNPGDQYLNCSLIDGHEFEIAMVSNEQRGAPNYTGISICLKLSDLKTHCVPIMNH